MPKGKGKKKKGKKKKKGAPVIALREIGEFKPSVHETAGEIIKLMEACRAGNVQLVHELILEQPLEDRVEFVNGVDEKGWCAGTYCLTSSIVPPVGWSASSNPSEDVQRIFQLLLDYGMDPAHQDNARNTLLHVCCNFDMAIGKPFIRMLIGLKAKHRDVNNTSKQEANMMHNNPQKMRKFMDEVKEEVDEMYELKQRTVVTKEERCYYKSMYDVLDVERSLAIQPHQVTPQLEQPHASIPDTNVFPDLVDAWAFFLELDHNKNGFVDFEEWVRACNIYFTKEAKADKKKNKKKGRKGKKKKKKK